MAAGNQPKTSVFEFSYKCVNLSLKEPTNIKVVFILRKGMFRFPASRGLSQGKNFCLVRDLC